jgi:CBS-domain-containing membrane protein
MYKKCRALNAGLKLRSELYRPSDRHLLAKLVPIFADRGCHMVSVMDPYSHILAFLDQSRYVFFQVVLSAVLTRLSEPHSRPTTTQIW